MREKGLIAFIKKILFMVSKNKCLRIVFFSSFKLFEKTVALPTRETNGLTLIVKKMKSRKHSPIPTLPGTAT